MGDDRSQQSDAHGERHAKAEVTLVLKVPPMTAGVSSEFTIRRLQHLAAGDVFRIRDFICVVGSKLTGSRGGTLPTDAGASEHERPEGEASVPHSPPRTVLQMESTASSHTAENPVAAPQTTSTSSMKPSAARSSPVWNEPKHPGSESDAHALRPASLGGNGQGEPPVTPSPDVQTKPTWPPAPAVADQVRSRIEPTRDEETGATLALSFPDPTPDAPSSIEDTPPRTSTIQVEGRHAAVAPRAPEPRPHRMTLAGGDLAQSVASLPEADRAIATHIDGEGPNEAVSPQANPLPHVVATADSTTAQLPDLRAVSAETNVATPKRNPLVDALAACAETARVCDPELTVPKVLRALDAFVVSFEETLDQRPSHFTNRLGQRTELATLEEWADLFVRSWLDSMVTYLSQSDVRANPDAPAPTAVRNLLRALQRDVLDVLSRDRDHTIRLLLDRVPVDRSTMEVAGVIGADRTTVAAQTAVSLEIGRRVRRRAQVLVG